MEISLSLLSLYTHTHTLTFITLHIHTQHILTCLVLNLKNMEYNFIMVCVLKIEHERSWIYGVVYLLKSQILDFPGESFSMCP